MKTVLETLETNALPHVQVSPVGAGPSPSKEISAKHEAMTFAPRPGIGQLLQSVKRAADYATADSLS